MSDMDDLVTAVRARTEGTPYVLEETPDGFDVHIDIVNASWFSLFAKQHLEKTFVYHVKAGQGTKVLAITDDAREVRWEGGVTGQGVPRFGASLSREVGRIQSVGFEKSWGVRNDGTVGKVVDYSFNAAEGRDLIRGPAQELGWTEQMGTQQRIGLYVALGTIALLVLAGVVVGVLALTVGL